MSRERRTFDAEFRKASPTKLRGHAAVFDTWYPVFGFLERVRPGAFRDVLEDDVRALFNHDPNIVLGRTRSGTLRLEEDRRGLRMDVDLPDTTWGRDLAVSIGRGDVSQASFAFRVLQEDEEWDSAPDGTPRRTIHRFDRLSDVSPVTFPASESTEVSVRAKLLKVSPVALEKAASLAKPASTRARPVVLTGHRLEEAVGRHGDEAWRTAVHEAGHAVALILTGAGLREAALTWRKRFGRLEPAGGHATPSRKGSRNRAATFLAGRVAEELFGVSDAGAARRAMEDHRSSTSALAREGRHGTRHADTERAEAARIVGDWRHAVEWIAALLLERGRVDGETVETVLLASTDATGRDQLRKAGVNVTRFVGDVPRPRTLASSGRRVRAYS